MNDEPDRTVTAVGPPARDDTPRENTTAPFDGPVAATASFLQKLLAPPDRPDCLGLLGEYRVLGVLGQGGMGVVLRAEDTRIHRPVAIKLMKPDVAAHPAARERFLREARAMGAAEHPRIVAIYRVGEWRGTPFLVMPLMKGCSLADRLKRPPALTVAEAIRFGREAAEGLAAAHARGLVHRDIKPDNIWLEDTPDGPHVRLLDFGLARIDTADALTKSGSVFGTPSYMAPEQAMGAAVDGRADLFSLGCVLYELTTGVKAFRGPTTTSILYAIANHTPDPPHAVNPAVPAGLSAYIQHLLAKDREQRPATAAEAVDALRAMEGGGTGKDVRSSLVAPQATQLAGPATAGLPVKDGTAGQDSGIVILSVPPRPPRREYANRNRIARIVVAVLFAALSAAAAVSLLLLPSYFRPAGTRTESGSDAAAETPNRSSVPDVPLPVPEALRVTALDIARLVTKTSDLLGYIGKDPNAVSLGESVRITARFTRPAYAYVLIFQPDGTVVSCYPPNGDQVPPLSDTASYPSIGFGTGPKDAWLLEEGTGLWAIAVVASETPLPSYSAWQMQHKTDWKHHDCGTGVMWMYDDGRLDPLPLGGGGVRAGGAKLTGTPATIADLGKRLAFAPGVKVRVIGFGVGPGK